MMNARVPVEHRIANSVTGACVGLLATIWLVGCGADLPAPGILASSSSEPAQDVDSAVQPAPAASCEQPTPEASCTGGFCTLRPGCFVMGAPRSEFASAKSADQQVQVTLTRSFELGQTEVTRAAWLAEGLPPPSRARLAGSADCVQDACPVTNVSFFDAAAFANLYSTRRGLQPCYTLSGCEGEPGQGLRCQSVQLTADSAYQCTGYRLPTEAEWEYAARAGTATAFYSGDITPQDAPSGCEPDAALERIGWYCHNAQGAAHAVAQKEPNGWGLYDTAGNVAEWCNDLYDGSGYGQGALVDPTGTLTPGRDLMPAMESGQPRDERVLRGGNHVMWAGLAKAATRFAASQRGADSGIGFRLARTLPEAASGR